MKILLITLGVCVLFLIGIFMFIWHKTDWKKLDESNSRYINGDGDHIYYDRKLIQHKRRKYHDS